MSRDGIFAVTSAESDCDGSFDVNVIDLCDNVAEVGPWDVLAAASRVHERVDNVMTSYRCCGS